MRAVRLLLISMPAWASVASAQTEAKPTGTPLDAEAVAVYRAAVMSLIKDSTFVVQVTNKTRLLSMPVHSLDSCLAGFTLEDRSAHAEEIHELDARVVEGMRAALVGYSPRNSTAGNAAAGSAQSPPNGRRPARNSPLLAVSEIAFDTAHRYAVLHFTLTSGGISGRGGLVVLRKAEGERWQSTDRPCRRDIIK